jgi:hypothetical protein
MKFKVYIDYTTEQIPRPFYVGKGHHRRVKLFSRNKLHTAISNKYGFDRRVVFETDDEQEAFVKEIELIAEHNTYVYSGGWGANFTRGGEGKSETKHSNALKSENHPMWGRHHTEESKRKNSESNKTAQLGRKNGMYGKHHSEETRKKISDNQKGWHHTEEAKQSIGLAVSKRQIGSKRSEETKQKISQACKNKKPWNKGKKFGSRKTKRVFSAQARKNISEARKGRTTWNKGLKTATKINIIDTIKTDDQSHS